MPDTNYTALAAECERRAEQGEKPVLEWIPALGGVFHTPSWRGFNVCVERLDSHAIVYTDRRAPYRVCLSLPDSAQLFAEALLCDATKLLHQEAYEVREAYAVAARVIALHLKDQSTPELEGLTYDQYISELARKSGAEITALRAENQRLRTALDGLIDGARIAWRDLLECAQVANSHVQVSEGNPEFPAARLFHRAGLERTEEVMLILGKATETARAALSPEAPTAAKEPKP